MPDQSLMLSRIKKFGEQVANCTLAAPTIGPQYKWGAS